MWENLTGALHCARDLRLVNAGHTRILSMDENEQYLAEKSVWYLYFSETGYAIHKGMLPVSDIPTHSSHLVENSTA